VTKIGYRIVSERPRIEQGVLDRCAALESVYLADAMAKFGALAANVKAIEPGMRAIGRALTVRAAAGDNMAGYLAMRYIEPGDVLVIECRGQQQVAQWGDLASAVAKERGAAGVVMDGATRDRIGMVSVGLPVFANPAFVSNGSSRVGPGEINVPVAVGDVAILPGDLIFGDDHGVVAVPSAYALAVVEAAERIAEQDGVKMRGAAAGDPTITSWVDGAMKASGYDI
jgi:regulator of RNase E activity RraA